VDRLQPTVGPRRTPRLSFIMEGIAQLNPIYYPRITSPVTSPDTPVTCSHERAPQPLGFIISSPHELLSSISPNQNTLLVGTSRMQTQGDEKRHLPLECHQPSTGQQDPLLSYAIRSPIHHAPRSAKNSADYVVFRHNRCYAYYCENLGIRFGVQDPARRIDVCVQLGKPKCSGASCLWICDGGRSIAVAQHCEVTNLGWVRSWTRTMPLCCTVLAMSDRDPISMWDMNA